MFLFNQNHSGECRNQIGVDNVTWHQLDRILQIDPYRNDRIGEQAMAIGAGVIAFIVFAVCGFCCCVVFICKKLAGQRKSSGGGNHSHSSISSDAGKDHEEPPPVGYNPYSGEMSVPVAPPGGSPINHPPPPAPGTILPPVPGQPAVAPAPGYDAPPPYQPYPPAAPTGDTAAPYPAGNKAILIYSLADVVLSPAKYKPLGYY